MDIPIITALFKPSYAAMVSLRKIPLFGLVCQACSCVFVNRGGSADEKETVVDQISERQRLIEENGVLKPLCVFPEGATSNGSYLLSFKRGVFLSSRSMRPIVLKYSYSLVSPAYDIIPYMALMTLLQCLV